MSEAAGEHEPVRSSVTPQPRSQSVSGSAPTNRNTWPIGRCSSTPVRSSRQVTRRVLRWVAVELGQLRVSMELDVGRRVDAIDQIARHAGREARVRGPACEPSTPIARGTRRPARPNCRRRPAPLRSARTFFASSAEAQYDTPRPSNSLRRGTSGRRYRAPLAITIVFALSLRPSRSVRPSSPAAPGLRAVERRRLRRDQDLGAEFLRLHERAAGERRAGNAGRKAEVILDARAGARLAAVRSAVEHDDVQSFGSRVDGGREARRARRRRRRRRRAPGARSCRECRGSAPARLRTG